MQVNRSVVILAAGLGSRFAQQGFTVPKPLIEFGGESFLKHTVELARMFAPQQLIVVATPALAPAVRATPGVTHCVVVETTQQGPAASGVLACGVVPKGTQLVFLDCDNLYENPSRWIDGVPTRAPFMTVAELPDDLEPSSFCNVQRTSRDCVARLAEKAPLSDAAFGTGIYGFSNVDTFQRSAWALLSEQDREVPMSSVLWHAHGDTIQLVDVAGWHPVGTPEQLNAVASRL